MEFLFPFRGPFWSLSLTLLNCRFSKGFGLGDSSVSGLKGLRCHLHEKEMSVWTARVVRVAGRVERVVPWVTPNPSEWGRDPSIHTVLSCSCSGEVRLEVGYSKRILTLYGRSEHPFFRAIPFLVYPSE